MKILFVAAHRRDRSPSQRFRFEQYLEYLSSKGWDVSFSYLLNQQADQVIYRPGNYFAKARIFIQALLKRYKDLRIAKEMDIVFVQREAMMIGSTYFEKSFSRISRLVFDFDDSIWLPDFNPHQGILNKLKNPSKTAKIIKLCDLIIAGNEYLASYARKYNDNVIIIPTTIDTDEYQRVNIKGKDQKICIGWSGSFSTIKHFETVIPALEAIKRKYGDQITFKVIGDGDYENKNLEISGIPWQKEIEIEELSEIDIGLMPLPDDEWSKGKCALKGLQYMALEIPAIMSPVGVNNDIIQEGKNGFLAKNIDEWIDRISLLIENPDLRLKLGKAGRTTVVEQYSVQANKEKYLAAFSDLTKRES